jgi:hypothetical protein
VFDFPARNMALISFRVKLRSKTLASGSHLPARRTKQAEFSRRLPPRPELGLKSLVGIVNQHHQASKKSSPQTLVLKSGKPTMMSSPWFVWQARG